MNNHFTRSINAYIQEDLAKHLKYIGIGIGAGATAFIAAVAWTFKKRDSLDPNPVHYTQKEIDNLDYVTEYGERKRRENNEQDRIRNEEFRRNMDRIRNEANNYQTQTNNYQTQTNNYPKQESRTMNLKTFQALVRGPGFYGTRYVQAASINEAKTVFESMYSGCSVNCVTWAPTNYS